MEETKTEKSYVEKFKEELEIAGVETENVDLTTQMFNQYIEEENQIPETEIPNRRIGKKEKYRLEKKAKKERLNRERNSIFNKIKAEEFETYMKENRIVEIQQAEKERNWAFIILNELEQQKKDREERAEREKNAKKITLAESGLRYLSPHVDQPLDKTVFYQQFYQ